MVSGRTFSTDLDTAIDELPAPVGEFFRRLLRNPRFRCTAGRMQMQIWFDDEKAGGLNRAHSHWYISRIFADKVGGERTLKEYGVTYVTHKATHAYWKTQGNNSLQKFQTALQCLTGVQL